MGMNTGQVLFINFKEKKLLHRCPFCGFLMDKSGWPNTQFICGPGIGQHSPRKDKVGTGK